MSYNRTKKIASGQIRKKRPAKVQIPELLIYRTGDVPLTSSKKFKTSFAKFKEQMDEAVDMIELELPTEESVASSASHDPKFVDQALIPEHLRCDDCMIYPSETVIDHQIANGLNNFEDLAQFYEEAKNIEAEHVKSLAEDGVKNPRPSKAIRKNTRTTRTAYLDSIQTYSPNISSAEALQKPFLELQKRRSDILQQKLKNKLNTITTNSLQYQIDKVTREKGMQQISPQEVVLRLSIYTAEEHVKTQEFLVLGSQLLSDLKDSVYCVSDKLSEEAKQCPSGLFFIEDKFYEISDAPNSIRYSIPITEWVKSKSRYMQEGLGRYESRAMEDTKFDDVDIRLGSHYLFCHQANCRHIVIFNEIRILSKEDCQNAQCYPLRIFKRRVKQRKCGVCAVLFADCVVYGDKLADESPKFYCKECYNRLHFNGQGQLYDDFRKFKYFHD
eukprot:146948_1